MRTLATISLAIVAAWPAAAAQGLPRPEAPRPRIVTFAPSLTQIAFDMGLGDHVVGVTRFCRLPEGVARPRVGDAFSINASVILDVRPDVLLCQTAAEKFRSVREIDPSVRIVEFKTDRLKDIAATIEQLGEAVGRPALGEQQRAAFESRIEYLRRLTAGRGRPRVLFVMGTERPVAAGPGTFIGELIEAAGGLNAGADIPGQTDYRRTQVADVAAAAPDVLVVHCDSPASEAANREYWLQWKDDVPAARMGRVFAVSDPHWSIPSTRTPRLGLELVAMLHPDATAAPRPAAPGGEKTTLLSATLRRLLAAAIVGAALAAAGAAMQGLLRNPLAEPYLLGVSSGAGVGVLLGLAMAAWYALPKWASTPALAFVGAMASCAVVYFVAQRRGRLDPYSLILSGVIINTFNAAILLTINLYIDPDRIASFTYWAMGSLPDSPDRTALWVCGPCVLAGLAVLLAHASAFNLLGLGDEVAASSGVHVHRLRIVTFACVGLMTAAAVALAGPIGFLGLIIPHLCRMVVGPGHHRLLLTSAVVGAGFLMGAEWLCRTAGSYVGVSLIPVGILTALAGGPFFIVLLRRRFRESAA